MTDNYPNPPQPENNGQPLPPQPPVDNGWQNTTGGIPQQPAQPVQPSQPGQQQWAYTTGPIPQYQPSQAPGQPPITKQQIDTGIGALFDLTFTRWATPLVVKIVYIIAMVLVGLLFLGGLISSVALMSQSGALGFLALIGTFFYTAFMLIMVRISLEASLSNIRIAQYAKEIVDLLKKD